RMPFTLYVITGIHGKGFADRELVRPLLRIAEKIRGDTGQWPRLTVEWETMCPGGLVKLDVTQLANMKDGRATLPEILENISCRLNRFQASTNGDFAEAEMFYKDNLKQLNSFSETIRTAQKEFDDEPICVINTNTKCRRLRFVTVLARITENTVD